MDDVLCEDPRWESIRAWLKQARPDQINRWLDMAYAAMVAAERLSNSPDVVD